MTANQRIGAACAAYALCGCIAWGHYIARGCGEIVERKCDTAGVRAVTGVMILPFWPVYAASVAFTKEQP